MVFSSKLNVSMLTVLLHQHGIRHIVLCPGSRNVPLVSNFTTDPYFECYQISDERSAAFFALGLAQYSSAPCAVCCTSGSALLNMHPAVWEAAAQRVPLLIISADRSKAWIGQKDGQTLEQHGVFGTLVKRAVELPQVLSSSDAEGYWFCQRLINEAAAEVSAAPYGPVHINVPISDPLFEYGDNPPPVRRFNIGTLSEALSVLEKGRRRLLIIGQRPDLLQLSPAVCEGLKRNFIIFSEHLANINGLSDGSALEMLLGAAGARAALAPDVVAVLGGHIIAKHLKRFLRSLRCAHVEFGSEFTDTFQNLCCLVRKHPDDAQLLAQLAALHPPADNAFAAQLRDAFCKLNTSRSLPYSQLLITKLVMAGMRPGECLHLANSSTVRCAQYFPLADGVRVLCNRGVNGIDGSLSTAVGFATTSPCINFIITGDLAFFYDVAALWQRQLPPNLKIVLINNGGGGIFAAIRDFKIPSQARHFVIADHQTRAAELCRAHDLAYYRATTQQELEQGLQALRASSQTGVLECLSDMAQDQSCLQDFLKGLYPDTGCPVPQGTL